MSKLLMISGDRMLAQGKKGAFYNTLEEFHKYWERIDVICPKAISYKLEVPIPPRRDRGSSIPQSGIGTISYKLLYHIDAYRLKNERELIGLGIEEIFSDPQNIILIEWADRVKKILPQKYISIHMDHLSEKKRKINITG